MTTFTVEIDCDNAAFQDEDAREYEIGRILRDLAGTIEAGPRLDKEIGGPLRDENGNTVGSWSMDE